jgi:hypothetical protein
MCLLVQDREFLFKDGNNGEEADHVVYADQRLVERCSKRLSSARTNPETACHAYAVRFQQTNPPATTDLPGPRVKAIPSTS